MSSRTRLDVAAPAIGALTVMLWSAAAAAAGLGIPDLGAAGLGQAGAWIAHPTDGTAIYYNPAGLATLRGLTIELDGRLTQQQVGFARAPLQGFKFDPVQNTGSASFAPMFTISYRIEPKGLFPITFAIGGHPFNGMTGFRYPDPTSYPATMNALEVAKATPQRYSDIASSSEIYVPVIAVAAEVFPWLDLGAGFQTPVAHISSKQAIYAAPVNLGEKASGTAYDAVFQVQTNDDVRPSGILGASVRILHDLYGGFAFQLPTYFRAQGTISVDLPPTLQQLVTVTGNQVQVDVKFPWIARMGFRYVRPNFEIELAGTYEAWSEQSTLTLVPENIKLKALGSTVALAPILIHQDLQDAGSLRLGGLVRGSLFSPKLSFLVLRAGVLGETSAVPEDHQTIGVPDWQRIGVTCGVGFRYRNYELSFAYGHLYQPPLTVTNSQVMQTVAFTKNVTPSIVGNGTFTSQIDMGAVMLAAHFL